MDSEDPGQELSKRREDALITAAQQLRELRRERLNFKVLDHGYLRYIDHMGSDEGIVEAARMSTGRGFISWDPYERCKACGAVWLKHQDGTYSLMAGYSQMPCCDNNPKMITEKFPNGDMGMLENLWVNKHSTPFEMGELEIEVKAPIMVFREWHRHRTQSYSEMSARYTQMPNEHYVPNPERIQKQSKSNKQGSAEALPLDDALKVVAELREEQADVYEHYDAMVGDGIAKEVARVNCPVSRYSVMRAKTDVRNWMAFFALRRPSDAQWEIRQYAEAGFNVCKEFFSRTCGLFEEHTLYGVSFSRTEMRLLRKIMREGIVPFTRNLIDDTLGRKAAAFLKKVTED